MEARFWHERWDKGEIGFHQHDGNRSLRIGADALGLVPGARVLVPLCGKSVDMAWLRERGCEVLGVELSEVAVAAFFEERGVSPETSDGGAGLRRYAGHGYTLYVGDFFALGGSQLGRLDAVFDRAALVALPADLRRRYAGHLKRLAGAAPIVLVTLGYHPAEMNGPPFTVVDAEVETLFGATHALSRLTAREVLEEESGLRKRGLSSLTETCWLLSPVG